MSTHRRRSEIQESGRAQPEVARHEHERDRVPERTRAEPGVEIQADAAPRTATAIIAVDMLHEGVRAHIWTDGCAHIERVDLRLRLGVRSSNLFGRAMRPMT